LKGELSFIKSFLEFQAGSTNDQRLTKLSTLRSSFNNIKVSQLFLDFARVHSTTMSISTINLVEIILKVSRNEN